MKWFLMWVLLLLGADAHAEVRIWFDARSPFARPMATITLGGRRGMALLDTGSSGQFIGVSWAKLGKAALTAVGIDYAHRPILGSPAVGVSLALDGWGAIEPPIWVSDWPEREQHRGGPHIDAVLSPQSLLPPGQVMVLDFTRSRLDHGSWSEALGALSDLPLLIADVRADEDGKFVVEAQVGGELAHLVIDTGAPHSLVYIARGEDLPPKAVRSGLRHARVRLGRLQTELQLEVLEPLPPGGPYDGLLGMDLLRGCAIAFDDKRLVGRCAQP